MITLLAIIIGLAGAVMADESEGMQGLGLGVAIGALVVGVGSWGLG